MKFLYLTMFVNDLSAHWHLHVGMKLQTVYKSHILILQCVAIHVY